MVNRHHAVTSNIYTRTMREMSTTVENVHNRGGNVLNGGEIEYGLEKRDTTCSTLVIQVKNVQN